MTRNSKTKAEPFLTNSKLRKGDKKTSKEERRHSRQNTKTMEHRGMQARTMRRLQIQPQRSMVPLM